MIQYVLVKARRCAGLFFCFLPSPEQLTYEMLLLINRKIYNLFPQQLQ